MRHFDVLTKKHSRQPIKEQKYIQMKKNNGKVLMIKNYFYIIERNCIILGSTVATADNGFNQSTYLQSERKL